MKAEYLREIPAGTKLANHVGAFRLVRYCPATDKYQIVWERWPDFVEYMDGGALVSFMAFCED